MRHPYPTAIVLVVSVVAIIGTQGTTISAQSPPSAGYGAVGDSIELGVGDNDTGDGIGYVEPFGTFLAGLLGQPVQVHNFSFSGAQTRDIRLVELPPALDFARAHQPVVVTWGGGGNDLGTVGLTHQAAACMQTPSCLGRFNGLLNEAEAAIDHTIRALREAVGPDARILMRTQYNALAKTGCATPEVAALGAAVLEGVPGTVLDRGLNVRIKAVAAKYGATVVDLFIPFAFNPNVFVAADCSHPSGAGYHAILVLFEAAFLSAP